MAPTQLQRDPALFEPSLRDLDRSAPGAGARPWRLGSQVYVAFFGGPLAVAVIAWLNARRLGMPTTKRHALLAVGVAGFTATIVAALVAADALSGSRRLLASFVGLAAYGLLFLVQRPYDRAYHAFTHGDEDELYDSLTNPGVLATLGFGAVQFVALYLAFART